MAETILSLYDERGDLISSNAAHARMIGRPQASIVGKSWRDWTPKPLLDQAEVAFARCVAGEPIGMLGQILRPDGAIALCRFQGFSTRRESRLVVVNTIQLISIAPTIVPREAFATLAYINDLAKDLAEMSTQAGLEKLGKALDSVAHEAGEMADFLRDDAASRH